MRLNDIADKNILIWGYGREGKSTEDFLKKHCPDSSVEIFEGSLDEIDRDRYDYIFKSPGIPMDEEDPKFISQTELFLQLFSKQTIGITGTKGKSTTSALLHHVLSECLSQRVLLVGNIGRPCLDYFDEIDKDTVVVFEMSCHQLAHISISPHIAVFLNLYEEHLDYYKTMEKYYAAKCNIAKYQGEDDYLFLGSNVPSISNAGSQIMITDDGSYSYDLSILGKHNVYNAHFVYKISSSIFGIDDESIRKALKTFTGLSHRLQYIGTKDKISFYDDSISTIPNATIQALESVSNAQTVIIGGMDRGIDYSVLIQFINSNTQYNYVLAYETGKRIYDSIAQTSNCYLVKDLDEAVALSKRITDENRSCILSPAAASYGYFKNFEERGEYFTKLALA